MEALAEFFSQAEKSIRIVVGDKDEFAEVAEALQLAGDLALSEEREDSENTG